MGNKVPLLSICIPTYNRAIYLEEALKNITRDKAFGEEVEIVISDNASTDDTQLITEKYIDQYNNIRYYRNEKNIRDRNFILALSRGNGKYVRLFNDTLRFKEGALSKMLEVIRSSKEDSPLFFYQNIDFLNSNTNKEVNGTSAFISNTSYWVTWIANFGNWKVIVDKIPSPNECAHLLLTQVDWSFKIMEIYKEAKIYYGDYFESVVPNKKGGYNLFEVFVNNYFFIVRKCLHRGFVFQREKYRLFRYFLLLWIGTLYNQGDKYTFDKKGVWRILFKEYWIYPYFYVGLLFVWFKSRKSTESILTNFKNQP